MCCSHFIFICSKSLSLWGFLVNSYGVLQELYYPYDTFRSLCDSTPFFISSFPADLTFSSHWTGMVLISLVLQASCSIYIPFCKRQSTCVNDNTCPILWLCCSSISAGTHSWGLLLEGVMTEPIHPFDKLNQSVQGHHVSGIQSQGSFCSHLNGVFEGVGLLFPFSGSRMEASTTWWISRENKDY